MKSVALIIVLMTLYATKVDAQQYSLACGRIISIKQNKAEVDIFSRVCHGKHFVEIQNKNTQGNLINKENCVMQIDKSCSKIILLNTNNKGIQ